MRNQHGFLAVTTLAAALFAGRARADEAADHYNLGLQLKHQGKSADAIAEMEKAIKLRSDYAAAYLSLGNLWRAQGEYAKAATALEQAVKLQPKDALSHANLGAVYVREKRFDDSGVAGLGSEEERRDAAETRHGLGVGAARQERAREIGVFAGCRPMERGHAVALCRIDVDALFYEIANDIGFAAHGGVRKSGIAGSGGQGE